MKQTELTNNQRKALRGMIYMTIIIYIFIGFVLVKEILLG